MQGKKGIKRLATRILFADTSFYIFVLLTDRYFMQVKMRSLTTTWHGRSKISVTINCL
jgi:hypothetical protein